MIWKMRRPKLSVSTARVPDGLRVYAIGDVHGRVDLLKVVLARIDADRGMLPSKKTMHVFLGDYVDRGPCSREVINVLIARGKRYPSVYLKGNHEAYLLEFLKNPSILATWRLYGGLDTLLSYGLTPSIAPNMQESVTLSSLLNAALPKSHLRFFDSLESSHICGDYYFVHAGIRPGVSLARQREADLLWIRNEFILNEESYTKIVVHGHTPVVEPEIRSNRINIDTGAYTTGRLTCLALEADQRRFI